MVRTPLAKSPAIHIFDKLPIRADAPKTATKRSVREFNYAGCRGKVEPAASPRQAERSMEMDDAQNIELDCHEKCELTRQECEAIATDSSDCESRWDFCVSECASTNY
jgi:hypothetical protein